MNPDDTSSNILHILNNFNLFLRTLENTYWIKKATAEIIKNSFKLSSFIEKAIANLNTKDISIQFIELLKKWVWENEKKNINYKVEFFEFASDSILEIFLFNRAVTIPSSDIALRIYTSLYPIDRLQKFLKKQILKHSSYSVILKVLLESSIDPLEVETGMVLMDLTKLMQQEQIENVKVNVYEMCSSYRLKKALPVLLKIISMPCTNRDLRIIIIETLQEKLIDRTSLNKYFWIFIFKELNVEILANACKENKILRDELFNFIEYTGSMMNCLIVNSQRSWVPNSQYTLCPEITYDDLIKIIKVICAINFEIKQEILSKIANAQKHSTVNLWDDVLFSL